jgi:predicted O-methyltransferase YrrM
VVEPAAVPDDTREAYEQADLDIVNEARLFTMTSNARIVAAIDAVDFAVRRGVPGSIVECGVWRGGSVMAMIRALQRHGVEDRDVYLFDTFTGMTKPSDADVSDYDPPALATWQESEANDQRAWDWAFAPEVFNLESVRDVILATGYPEQRLHFVEGPVEDTLPAGAPESIAVLRLDTDWYESTLHELIHLYPRLSTGGVLIVDDYGHWKGARQAVDEYFSSEAEPLLLSRVDYTGRMGVKF